MMKKFLTFALSATLVLGLTACGGTDEKESSLLANVLDAMASSGASRDSDDSDNSRKSSTPPRRLR